jgi:hypothetical protein
LAIPALELEKMSSKFIIASIHAFPYFDAVREVGHANVIALKPKMSVIMLDIFLDVIEDI